MADIIRITAAEIEGLAKNFQSASTETTDLVNKLEGEVSSVASGWEGDSYNAFVDKFAEIKKQMQTVSEMYEGIHDLLNNVVKEMQAADDQIAGAIRS